jgi:hypothetical protein
MKKLTVITAVIVSILLILAFTGGCKKNLAERLAEETIEKAIEKESGEDVEIDLDEGEVTIQGDDGEVNISADEDTVEIKSDEGEATFGSGADLPEGFPGDVPVYENMDLHLAMSTRDGYLLSGISQDSVAEIVDWYKDKLKDWKIVDEATFETEEGKSINLTVTKGDMDMTIMILDTEEGAGINQTLGE